MIRPLAWRVVQNMVYVATEIQQMSLETVLFLHK